MSTKVICIASQKGGTGTTTTAISLAHGLSQKGRRVLLIDLDPQGQCTAALGRNPESGAFHLLTMGTTPQETTFVRSWIRFSGRTGLYLLAGDQQTIAAQTVLNAQDKPISSLRESIQRFFKDSLHYILFDTSPSVGGIQERAIWASDLVIVPTATEFPSADGASKILLTMNNLQEKRNWRGNLLGILPTFYDEQKSECNATLDGLRERFDASLLSPIHRATLLRECIAEGRTIFEADPLCRAAKQYQALTQQVMKFQGQP
ncbi:MAG TPA: ParA family protein [Anaerolineales bacterium]|nr:ParA family protein [Anaerolineales bacterium]